MNNKTVWILRGCSGAGKDYVSSKLFKKFSGSTIIVSADNYFVDNLGNYNFDSSKLTDAHNHCRKMFAMALDDPIVTDIIVNNTNTQEKEWEFYLSLANNYNCDVIFLVVEKRHDGMNSHQVLGDVIDRHEQRIKESLKLR